MHGFDIGDMQATLLHQMHAYWDSRRIGGSLPRKSAIDPADIKPLLPFVSVADHVGQPPRFRFRLVGTEVAAVNRLDFTGCWLDEIDFDASGADWIALYRLVGEEGRPLFGRAWLIGVSGCRFEYEFGLFPLSDDGVQVGHSLCLEDFSGARRQVGETWSKAELRSFALREPPMLSAR